MEPVEKQTVGQVSVSIYYDQTSLDIDEEFQIDRDSHIIPCSFYHRRSTVAQLNPFDSEAEMFEFAKEKGYHVFKLSRYEHGMVGFSAFGLSEEPYGEHSCQWDAGIEGFILVKPEPEEDEDKALDRARDWLRYLSDFCNGNVYGYIIRDSHDDELDSCWGIVGYGEVEQLAMDEANRLNKTLPEQGELNYGETGA